MASTVPGRQQAEGGEWQTVPVAIWVLLNERETDYLANLSA